MAHPAPRTVIELDRDSVDHARFVVEQRLLPLADIRQPLLEVLADTVEECRSKPAAWSMKLAPWEVLLNAGSALILRIRSNELGVSFDDRALGDDDRQWLGEHQIAAPGETFGAGVRFVELPLAAAARATDVIRRMAQSAVAREHASKEGRINWWEANSPGAISYLEQELGRNLPHPDYTQGAARTRYWKIAPGAQAWQWEECREKGFIAIGWARLGDLRRFHSREEFERVREELERDDPEYTKVACAQAWQFRHLKKGDRVLANRGISQILGVGTVMGEYLHDPSDERHPHRIAVRWDNTAPIAVNELGWRKTLIELGKATFERLVRFDPPPPPPPPTGFAAISKALSGSGYYFRDELLSAFLLGLQAKRFVILSGISGTGKTRMALEIAKHFSGTRTELVAFDVPENAIEVTVAPYMIQHRRLVVPVELLSTLDLPVLGERNSAEISVGFPGGVEITRLWKAPLRDVAAFGLSGALGQWFRKTLAPGDTFILEAPDLKEGPFFRVGLPKRHEREVQLDAVEVVAVRPDWTDNRSLLGFYNPLTEQYVTTPFLDLLMRAVEETERAGRERRDPLPFFVILDEMNLARVEQYFSDFLSALESGEPIHLHDSTDVEEGRAAGRSVPRKLGIPANLFVVGTVNVDESTYMFSPKVLDRAFTLELDEVDLLAMGGLEPRAPSTLALNALPETLRVAERPGPADWTRLCEDHRDVAEAVHAVNEVLRAQHRHFGYRVAGEIARYVLLAHQQAGEEAVDAAVDLALLQKVLPKLSGTQQELEPTLDALFAFAVHGDAPSDKDVEALRVDSAWTVDSRGLLARADTLRPPDADITADAGLAANMSEAVYPRTAAKLWRMRRRLRQQGFTSFIE